MLFTVWTLVQMGLLFAVWTLVQVSLTVHIVFNWFYFHYLYFVFSLLSNFFVASLALF